MTETVWVALIAVAGTALGASISPLIAVIGDSVTQRSDANAKRIKATADFALALQSYASTDPNRFDRYNVRKARAAAIAARFSLARHLPRGAGRVDRFAEVAIASIGALSTADEREAVALDAAQKLLTWARGDIRPRHLDFVAGGS